MQHPLPRNTQTYTETPAEEAVQVKHRTRYGKIHLGDSRRFMESLASTSVDLIVTSPPFPLIAKKAYGNPSAEEYLQWFKPFAEAFKRVLKTNGSLVLDTGSGWTQGLPTRSLYQYELILMLCREMGFHLAQEFYWWNPTRLPVPTEWVGRRRIRVKDAVNCVWWLSLTPWPKASNRRVLTPYRQAGKPEAVARPEVRIRPDGRRIRDGFAQTEAGSIPPNLLAIANSVSDSAYLRYCKEHNLPVHPARFPEALPQYFIRMLTDAGDTVLDPFAGSCVTGVVAERLKRNWMCCERVPAYVQSGIGRFAAKGSTPKTSSKKPASYAVPNPQALWTNESAAPLDPAGGQRSNDD